MSSFLGALFTGTTTVVFESQSISPLSKTAISLDCSVKETHSQETTPTEFEIENGQGISDHIIVKPINLSIQGIISDTPLSLVAGLITTGISAVVPGAAALGKSAGALAALPGLSGFFGGSPSIKSYLTLKQIQTSGQPVKVTTSLAVYNNMWITKISVPRDSKTGKCLLFDIDLKQLLLVSPLTINLSILKNADVAAPKNEQGDKQNQELIDAAKKGEKAGTAAASAGGV